MISLNMEKAFNPDFYRKIVDNQKWEGALKAEMITEKITIKCAVSGIAR
jgi:hypothetical protein